MALRASTCGGVKNKGLQTKKTKHTQYTKYSGNLFLRGRLGIILFASEPSLRIINVKLHLLILQ